MGCKGVEEWGRLGKVGIRPKPWNLISFGKILCLLKSNFSKILAHGWQFPVFPGFLCLGNLDAGHMGIWDLGNWYLGTLVFASPEGTWHHRCVEGRPHKGFRHLGQGSCWRHSTCNDMAFQKEENAAVV